MESILIVDDDITLCNVLSEELNEAGYNAKFLLSGENVARYLNENKTDVVLLDLNLPGKNGFEIQDEINHRSGSKTNVIILTAYSDEISAIKSARLGASEYLFKPYDIQELLASVKKVLQARN
jgi:DNA-binding response OmpR family regulator